MIRFTMQVALVWFVAFSAAQAVDGAVARATDGAVERSSLFSLKPADVIEDAGVITITSGNSARTESFESVRHSDGTRTITSVITSYPADRPTGPDHEYRVEGRWVYDVNGVTTNAYGLGVYSSLLAEVEITARRPRAAISVSVGDQDRTVSVPCGQDCLIDLSPSVMAMFTVTRQFDVDSKESKSFNWIGQALNVDRALTEGGGSTVRLHALHPFGDLKVLQFLFFETLPGDDYAAPLEAAFNLYVDADHRPLAFATSRGTTAVRSGYENVMELFPPIFND